MGKRLESKPYQGLGGLREPGNDRRRCTMRSFRRIVMLLVVGVLVGVYAGSGISPAGAGDNGRDTVARGEMPVLESGTVVYHETLTKLGALLAAPSVSSNSAFPLDLSAFDYRTETWLLLGEQG